MAEHAAHPTAPIDDLDPHHESHHHGHVIIRPSTLVTVLVALLILTAVTVGAAQVESWIALRWQVHIPSLFNAFVCLSIAIVKSILVFMFFMQLKYDTPLNSIVMGFCFFAVGLFFFFTMTDLGNREAIYPYKSGEIQKGGLGINTTKDVVGPDGKPIKDAKGNALTTGVNTQNKPIVEWARLARIDKISELAAAGTLIPPLAPGETAEERYAKERDEAHSHARGGHKAHGPVLSSANRSRPPKAVGPSLYAEKKAEPAHDAHGGH